ncbi:MAG: restriction endonuclease subunit S [Rhodococcus sp. (in: high G+C Gram-positive bacteria)]
MRRQTIAQLAQRGALLYSDGYRTKRSELADDGFRIIRVADISDGFISLDSPDFVADSRSKSIGIKAGQDGDVLLTTKGTVGRVALIEDLRERVVYSPQLCFFRVLDPAAIDARYLKYWFNSPDFRHQSSYRKGNTDMADYINLRDISSLSIDLPLISQQAAIADILDALDRKIQLNRRMMQTAETLGIEIVRTCFVGDSMVALSDMAEVTMGSSPPGESYNDIGDGVVFFQGNRDFGFRYPTKRLWTSEPIRRAKRGDTLLSVRAPVGALNIATEDVCIGRGLASLRSTCDSPATLFYIVKSLRDVWEPFQSEGTVFGSINRNQLNDLPIPTIREKAATEAKLASLDGLVANAHAQNLSLVEARDTLLPKLMSGKLRVTEAKGHVAADR